MSKGGRGRWDKRTGKWRSGSPWHKLSENPGVERGQRPTNIRTPRQGACPVGKYNSMAEVYLCSDKGRHKIGVSYNCTRRMAAINAEEGFRPLVFATITCATRDLAEIVEKYLHWAFRAHRWDREWFVLPDEVVSRLKAARLSPPCWVVARVMSLDRATLEMLEELVFGIPEPVAKDADGGNLPPSC